MKRVILVLICTVIVSTGLAQTSKTPTPLITPPPSPAGQASNGVSRGSVTAFFPGKVITVKTELPNPMSFALSKSVRYLDKAGKEVKDDRIKPGARVRIYSEGNEDTRTATRVIIED